MAEIFTRFKNHDITLQQDGDDRNWYIRVRGPDGLYRYDGYWRESAGKTAKEALQEAKEGALLVKPPGVTARHWCHECMVNVKGPCSYKDCPVGVAVIAAANPSRDQGPCAVCGKPWREHGTYPVYESHNYTPASGVRVEGENDASTR